MQRANATLESARTTVADHERSRQGVVYGILSYGLWGLIPLYFKLVSHVAPEEVLAQRVAWSCALLALLITVFGRWKDLRRALGSRSTLAMLSASTLLLGFNWFVYIYAVSTNQVVEASLGYFLTPLVNVAIGVTILKEHLRRWQLASLVLAGVGVAILGAPLIAVCLALSFAFYGLLRKQVAVDGLLALAIETMLLLPLALAYIAYLETTGNAAFVASDPVTCVKLAASGVVTAVPLLLFAAAARRLKLSTMGFLQYLAPSVQFVLAVTVFDEELSAAKVAALAFIWTGLAIYTYDTLRAYRQERRALPPVEPADV